MKSTDQLAGQGTDKPPSRAAGHVRWVICAMLLYATSKNYVDRQVLGILAPELQLKFGWTEVQYGYMISAFQVAYSIGMIAAGRLIDRVGTRIGYALMMLVWSLASAAHALASAALGFGICRFLLGLGEGGNFPAALKTTAEWFPEKERSLATGIFNTGANIGIIASALLVPWIDLHYGWRATFLSTGVLGLIWLVWWWTSYQPPEKHPKITPQEYAYIRAGQVADDAESGEPAPSWRQLLRKPQTWSFAVAKFLTDPVWWFYLYWLPKFLDSRFHIGLSRIGIPLITVYLISDIGSIGGGWLPAFLVRHGMAFARARLTLLLFGALCVVPVILAAYTHHAWVAIAVVSMAACGHQIWSTNLFTTVPDMFPARAVGTVAGVGGTAGSVGGVLMASAAGATLQWVGTYTPLFLYAAIAYLIAFALILILAPGLRRVSLATG